LRFFEFFKAVIKATTVKRTMVNIQLKIPTATLRTKGAPSTSKAIDIIAQPIPRKKRLIPFGMYCNTDISFLWY